MLNEFEKAGKTKRALRQLKDELAHEGQFNQVAAINAYLLGASVDSFARLYDLLNHQPRNELLTDSEAAKAYALNNGGTGEGF